MEERRENTKMVEGGKVQSGSICILVFDYQAWIFLLTFVRSFTGSFSHACTLFSCYHLLKFIVDSHIVKINTVKGLPPFHSHTCPSPAATSLTIVFSVPILLSF